MLAIEWYQCGCCDPSLLSSFSRSNHFLGLHLQLKTVRWRWKSPADLPRLVRLSPLNCSCCRCAVPSRSYKFLVFIRAYKTASDKPWRVQRVAHSRWSGLASQSDTAQGWPGPASVTSGPVWLRGRNYAAESGQIPLSTPRSIIKHTSVTCDTYASWLLWPPLPQGHAIMEFVAPQAAQRFIAPASAARQQLLPKIASNRQ